MYGRGDMCSLLVGWSEGIKTLGRLGIDGRITAKWISKRRWGGMDWMNLVQDRDRWLALVSVVMNMQVSPTEGNFTG